MDDYPGAKNTALESGYSFAATSGAGHPIRIVDSQGNVVVKVTKYVGIQRSQLAMLAARNLNINNPAGGTPPVVVTFDPNNTYTTYEGFGWTDVYGRRVFAIESDINLAVGAESNSSPQKTFYLNWVRTDSPADIIIQMEPTVPPANYATVNIQQVNEQGGYDQLFTGIQYDLGAAASDADAKGFIIIYQTPNAANRYTVVMIDSSNHGTIKKDQIADVSQIALTGTWNTVTGDTYADTAYTVKSADADSNRFIILYQSENAPKYDVVKVAESGMVEAEMKASGETVQKVTGWHIKSRILQGNYTVDPALYYDVSNPLDVIGGYVPTATVTDGTATCDVTSSNKLHIRVPSEGYDNSVVVMVTYGKDKGWYALNDTTFGYTSISYDREYTGSETWGETIVLPTTFDSTQGNDVTVKQWVAGLPNGENVTITKNDQGNFVYTVAKSDSLSTDNFVYAVEDSGLLPYVKRVTQGGDLIYRIKADGSVYDVDGIAVSTRFFTSWTCTEETAYDVSTSPDGTIYTDSRIIFTPLVNDTFITLTFSTYYGEFSYNGSQRVSATTPAGGSMIDYRRNLAEVQSVKEFIDSYRVADADGGWNIVIYEAPNASNKYTVVQVPTTGAPIVTTNLTADSSTISNVGGWRVNGTTISGSTYTVKATDAGAGGFIVLYQTPGDQGKYAVVKVYSTFHEYTTDDISRNTSPGSTISGVQDWYVNGERIASSGYTIDAGTSEYLFDGFYYTDTQQNRVPLDIDGTVAITKSMTFVASWTPNDNNKKVFSYNYDGGHASISAIRDAVEAEEIKNGESKRFVADTELTLSIQPDSGYTIDLERMRGEFGYTLVGTEIYIDLLTADVPTDYTDHSFSSWRLWDTGSPTRALYDVTELTDRAKNGFLVYVANWSGVSSHAGNIALVFVTDAAMEHNAVYANVNDTPVLPTGSWRMWNQGQVLAGGSQYKVSASDAVDGFIIFVKDGMELGTYTAVFATEHGTAAGATTNLDYYYKDTNGNKYHKTDVSKVYRYENEDWTEYTVTNLAGRDGLFIVQFSTTDVAYKATREGEFYVASKTQYTTQIVDDVVKFNGYSIIVDGEGNAHIEDEHHNTVQMKLYWDAKLTDRIVDLTAIGGSQTIYKAEFSKCDPVQGFFSAKLDDGQTYYATAHDAATSGTKAPSAKVSYAKPNDVVETYMYKDIGEGAKHYMLTPYGSEYECFEDSILQYEISAYGSQYRDIFGTVWTMNSDGVMNVVSATVWTINLATNKESSSTITNLATLPDQYYLKDSYGNYYKGNYFGAKTLKIPTLYLTKTVNEGTVNQTLFVTYINDNEYVKVLSTVSIDGTNTVAKINNMAGSEGLTYMITGATGTIEDGSIHVSAGDVVRYDGSVWVKVDGTSTYYLKRNGSLINVADKVAVTGTLYYDSGKDHEYVSDYSMVSTVSKYSTDTEVRIDNVTYHRDGFGNLYYDWLGLPTELPNNRGYDWTFLLKDNIEITFYTKEVSYNINFVVNGNKVKATDLNAISTVASFDDGATATTELTVGAHVSGVDGWKVWNGSTSETIDGDYAVRSTDGDKHRHIVLHSYVNAADKYTVVKLDGDNVTITRGLAVNASVTGLTGWHVSNTSTGEVTTINGTYNVQAAHADGDRFIVIYKDENEANEYTVVKVDIAREFYGSDIPQYTIVAFDGPTSNRGVTWYTDPDYTNEYTVHGANHVLTPDNFETDVILPAMTADGKVFQNWTLFSSGSYSAAQELVFTDGSKHHANDTKNYFYIFEAVWNTSGSGMYKIIYASQYNGITGGNLVYSDGSQLMLKTIADEGFKGWKVWNMDGNSYRHAGGSSYTPTTDDAVKIGETYYILMVADWGEDLTYASNIVYASEYGDAPAMESVRKYQFTATRDITLYGHTGTYVVYLHDYDDTNAPMKFELVADENYRITIPQDHYSYGDYLFVGWSAAKDQSGKRLYTYAPEESINTSGLPERINLYPYYLADGKGTKYYDAQEITLELTLDSVLAQKQALTKGDSAALKVRYSDHEIDDTEHGGSATSSVTAKHAGTYTVYYAAMIKTPLHPDRGSITTYGNTETDYEFHGSATLKILKVDAYVIAPSANIRQGSGNIIAVSDPSKLSPGDTSGTNIALTSEDISLIGIVATDVSVMKLCDSSGDEIVAKRTISNVEQVIVKAGIIFVDDEYEAGHVSDNAYLKDYNLTFIDGSLVIYPKESSKYEGEGYV